MGFWFLMLDCPPASSKKGREIQWRLIATLSALNPTSKIQHQKSIHMSLLNEFQLLKKIKSVFLLFSGVNLFPVLYASIFVRFFLVNFLFSIVRASSSIWQVRDVICTGALQSRVSKSEADIGYSRLWLLSNTEFL